MNLPPQLSELVSPDRLCELGPGTPNAAALPRLQALRVEKAFAPHTVRDRAMATACLAGLWLLHDYLDQSHGISQELDTVEGSYWHAIMHRREPDASNSKYWWRRVGDHPVLKLLVEQCPALGYKYAHPRDFVDFCEKVRDTRTADEDLAKRVQRLEWQLLFDHCYTMAIS